MSVDAPAHQPLPVKGYRPQSPDTVEIVNTLKETEEVLLRVLDELQTRDAYDKRWLAVGRTHIEQGFMAVVRSIFKPARVKLGPEAE